LIYKLNYYSFNGLVVDLLIIIWWLVVVVGSFYLLAFSFYLLSFWSNMAQGPSVHGSLRHYWHHHCQLKLKMLSQEIDNPVPEKIQMFKRMQIQGKPSNYSQTRLPWQIQSLRAEAEAEVLNIKTGHRPLHLDAGQSDNVPLSRLCRGDIFRAKYRLC